MVILASTVLNTRCRAAIQRWCIGAQHPPRGIVQPNVSMHALSLTIIASSSTAYELRQQQLESRLERIEMSLDRSLQASGGAPGVTQDEFTFASNPDPPIAPSPQTVPLGSTSGEDKGAFPPVSNHIMSAVRSALGSSGVLATHNRTQDNDATGIDRRRASAKPISDTNSVARELHALGLGTVSRLVSEFYEECFPLYPAVDIASVQSHVNSLFSPAQWSPDTRTESLSVDDLDMLKAITAIAMQFSDDLQSPLKYNLLKYLNWNTNLCVYDGALAIEDIQISTLIVRLEARPHMQVPCC